MPVHDRMPTIVGMHLIRAAALVCHVGRAFILFVSTFSNPSVCLKKFSGMDLRRETGFCQGVGHNVRGFWSSHKYDLG